MILYVLYVPYVPVFTVCTVCMYIMLYLDTMAHIRMGKILVPYLGGWTTIYQLFWVHQVTLWHEVGKSYPYVYVYVCVKQLYYMM